MKNAVLLFFVWVLVTAGAIYLEFRLAKTERKWPGLVLPLVTFLYSLLVLFSYASWDSIAPGSGVSIVGESVAFFFAFLIANIPTFVFLAIYFAVREKKKRDEQMEKMHIKDL